MSLHSEILEQSDCLNSLLTTQRKNIEQIAKAIKNHNPPFVFLAARGTSDNAGRYANYLWGAVNELPLALATPSLYTYYQQPPQLNGALVVGISQSGQSPDIVSVLKEGKRQGCPTLAITNVPDSPLADIAAYVLDIQAGPELAVAATKTYTSELMVIAMLSAALSDSMTAWRNLSQIPHWVARSLSQDLVVAQTAQRYRYMQQCVVLGRGYNYATAFEWSLKLKELSYVAAEPYSTADFQHGPIAMVTNGFPIFAVVPKGKVFDSSMELLKYLHDELKAELIVISNSETAARLAQVPIRIPNQVPEWLSPLVAIIPAQLFAFHLTQSKGFDTENPRSIRKVTETH